MSVKPEGIRDIQLRLIEIAARGGDARPVLEQVAETFRDDQRANFARGGRPKWKPLSPQYAARKARLGKGTQVGVYTGGLRDSLTVEGDGYHLEQVRRDELKVGTTNPVANLFGGKHVERKQPKRKVVNLTPSRRRDYLQMVQDYLIEGSL